MQTYIPMMVLGQVMSTCTSLQKAQGQLLPEKYGKPQEGRLALRRTVGTQTQVQEYTMSLEEGLWDFPFPERPALRSLLRSIDSSKISAPRERWEPDYLTLLHLPMGCRSSAAERGCKKLQPRPRPRLLTTASLEQLLTITKL